MVNNKDLSISIKQMKIFIEAINSVETYIVVIQLLERKQIEEGLIQPHSLLTQKFLSIRFKGGNVIVALPNNLAIRHYQDSYLIT